MIVIKHTPGRIEVKGHAGYADIGHDIVCAGISTLVQNLVWSIEDLTEDKIQYVVNTGETVITYGDLSERAQLLLDSFFIGCNAIAVSYPGYVRVTNT